MRLSRRQTTLLVFHDNSGYAIGRICDVLRIYTGANKSLARPDKKKSTMKGRNFSCDAEVIAAAETWLDGQPSELLLSGLQKLRFWSL